jgi:Transposase, Mutator family
MQDTSTVARKPDGDRPARRLVDDELADELLGKAQAEGVALLGPDGLLSQVTKAVLERALAEEMTGHLGYDKHDAAGRGSGNNRNGSTGKTVLTDIGAVDLAVPRDRNGTFEPQIVRKGQTRLKGFNERIIALYARGMTTRDIRAHLREMYDVEVSPDLISRVTDAVLEELQEWQSRPLDPGRFLGIVANPGCSWRVPSSHELGWGAVVEAEAGAVVELGGDAVEFGVGVAVQVGAFGEVLAQQAVGVFVGAALPG